MSSRNEEERERLKQEYKEHYKRIKEAKERLKRSQQSAKIKQALDNMNPDALLESVDDFLGKVQEKVTGVEARLDVAMDSLSEDDTTGESLEEKMKREDEMKKIKAREALKQMKIEMGMLYSEIEKTADEIKAHKTIGREDDQNSDEQKAE